MLFACVGVAMTLGVVGLSAASAPAFAAPATYPTGAHPESVAIGDLNGDGKPELATANRDGRTVSVLANTGGGRFGAKLDYAAGFEPASLAIGDLNGDAKPDQATANYLPESTVSVLLNRGDGTFQAKLDYRTGPYSRSVVIGDLNSDHKPDLATANEQDNTVSVLANNTIIFCEVPRVKGRSCPTRSEQSRAASVVSGKSAVPTRRPSREGA